MTEHYSAIEKEQDWFICRDVDGPRDCHTDGSKLKREKQYCISTHICGL